MKKTLFIPILFIFMSFGMISCASNLDQEEILNNPETSFKIIKSERGSYNFKTGEMRLYNDKGIFDLKNISNNGTLSSERTYSKNDNGAVTCKLVVDVEKYINWMKGGSPVKFCDIYLEITDLGLCFYVDGTQYCFGTELVLTGLSQCHIDRALQLIEEDPTESMSLVCTE